MKDSILLKSDSVLTLKRKASNLMEFASKKKGAKKRIKKYLKLNGKLKRESHENLNY